MNSDNDRWSKVINGLCNAIDDVIEKDYLKDTVNKRKISLISSFLEFIKEDAEINTEIAENEVRYIVKMR